MNVIGKNIILVRDFSDFQVEPISNYEQYVRSKEMNKQKYRYIQQEFNKNLIGNLAQQKTSSCRVKVKKINTGSNKNSYVGEENSYVGDENSYVENEKDDQQPEEILFDRYLMNF